MSQVATLFRISEHDISGFITFPERVNPANIISIAKGHAEFHGSFVALEYLLAKGQPVNYQQIIGEIFNPSEILGEPIIENGDDYLQLFEMLESGKSIPYLSRQKVGLICPILESITSNDMAGRYNAKELNDGMIYPCTWHDRTDADDAFNGSHITTDFEILKSLFAVASNEGDCIISIIS